MTRFTIILLLALQTTITWAQKSDEKIIGAYYSTANKFERYSILILENDNKFIYKYGVGGCQAEVKGNWRTEGKKLRLTNDDEFLNNDIIKYPDMSLTTWSIKRTGVKPDKIIDSGCVKDNKLHVKKKRTTK